MSGDMANVAPMRGRVLICAGSDSGGGAGIQADIKAVTALGGFASTAITALTAQNTQGVHGIQDVPVAFLAQQMEVVLEDIGADAVKTGMLHTAEVIRTICSVLDRLAPAVPVVVDPVMVAKGGARLIDESALDTLKTDLLPRASVLTPNVPEAEILAGSTIRIEEDLLQVGRALLAMGPSAVLMKGGHLDGDGVVDILVTAEGEHRMRGPRVDTRHTHGTGCTLSSAIACGLAQGLAMEAAVQRARDYVLTAIQSAPGFGGGHGPLNHAHTVRAA